MYKAGTAELYTEADYVKERGELDDDDVPGIIDSRTDNYDVARCPVVYLPHSCDQWVIGGAEEVRAMIADLQVLLSKIEGDGRALAGRGK